MQSVVFFTLCAECVIVQFRVCSCAAGVESVFWPCTECVLVMYNVCSCHVQSVFVSCTVCVHVHTVFTMYSCSAGI